MNTGHWSSGCNHGNRKKYCAYRLSPPRRQKFHPRSLANRLETQSDAGTGICCTTRTIHGVGEYFSGRRTFDDGVPLVADIFASCPGRRRLVRLHLRRRQVKNIRPSGLTCGDCREDLLGRRTSVDAFGVRLRQQAANDSMLNTPPTFAVYLAGSHSSGSKQRGGLAAMEQVNNAAAELYGLHRRVRRLLSKRGRKDQIVRA